jgi:ABC-type dipeptide/oligopeptide/nickel transport system ATPase component
MISVSKTSLFALKDLSIAFALSQAARQVLSGVSIEIQNGECVALVGESGSGKTIACLAALGLLRGATISGRLFWKDEVFDLSAPRGLATLRGRHIAMLPQNFAGAFNPVRTIGSQMADVIRFHHGGSKRAAFERAASLLAELGVSAPEKRLHEFPHQQSGGILQRTALAMALSCEPELLIADEPTSALDVTSQHLLLELLSKIGKSRRLALLLVSHNLAVVGRLARRVYVLAEGRVVETGMTTDILTKPTTDATTRLLRAAQALALP